MHMTAKYQVLDAEIVHEVAVHRDKSHNESWASLWRSEASSLIWPYVVFFVFIPGCSLWFCLCLMWGTKQNRRGNYLRELFPLSPSNLSAASCRLWMIEAMPIVSASTGICAQARSWSEAFYVVMNKLCAGIKHYYINVDKLLEFERGVIWKSILL